MREAGRVGKTIFFVLEVHKVCFFCRIHTHVCVCVCVREKENGRESVCVCSRKGVVLVQISHLCVREGGREEGREGVREGGGEGGRDSVCVCLVFEAVKVMFSCRIRPSETKRGHMCQRECICKIEHMCQGKYMCKRECMC